MMIRSLETSTVIPGDEGEITLRIDALGIVVGSRSRSVNLTFGDFDSLVREVAAYRRAVAAAESGGGWQLMVERNSI